VAAPLGICDQVEEPHVRHDHRGLSGRPRRFRESAGSIRPDPRSGRRHLRRRIRPHGARRDRHPHRRRDHPRPRRPRQHRLDQEPRRRRLTS